MSCDIHLHTQKRDKEGNWETVEVKSRLSILDCNYNVFAFLAGVRNYSGILPISEPRGLPGEYLQSTDDWLNSNNPDIHSTSYLLMSELLSFDYDQPMEDRRCIRLTRTGAFDGGCTCEPGGGKMTTYRDYLGERYFKDLKTLKDAEVERIVFGFDN